MQIHLRLVVCLSMLAAIADAANSNTRAGTMLAYDDGQVFMVNCRSVPSGEEAAVLAHNKAINFIYQSDDCMPGDNMFIAVLDAIQGDFNPLWQEVQVVFDDPDFPCQQLTSATDVQTAAEEGLISLEPTDAIYRCAVIGLQEPDAEPALAFREIWPAVPIAARGGGPHSHNCANSRGPCVRMMRRSRL